MRRLRSRWTVVALVPAFFLAGFGLVTALAGSDDAAPTAAGVGSSGTGAEDVSTAASSGATTAVLPSTGTETTAGADGATGGAGAQGSGTTTPDDGASGNRAPAPPPGTIEVDYGRWEGSFEISEMEIVPEFGIATVTGEFRYLGGGDCSQVGAVVLKGQFYSPSGQPIGNGLWESIWVTGDGAEVPQREPLFLEFYGEVSEAAESARIRFTRVDCL